MFKLLLILAISVLSLTSSAADTDFPVEQSAAPGALSCSVTYLAQGSKVFIQPTELKKSVGATYLSGGYSQAGLDATDGKFEIAGSANISMDGSSVTGTVILRQNGKEVGRAEGVLAENNWIYLQIPTSGVTIAQKDHPEIQMEIFQVRANCSFSKK